MRKSLKKFLFVVSLVSATFAAFALGKRDVTYRDVENMDSWQETFDINEKKEGKYNIYVEAKDKGGNSSIAGPYNLFIDPDSDYAISGITNPINNMRVPGNLNIVGTCVDDDGVAEVWLVFDGGEPVKAEGKEFWSYYLDTNELAEGPHTIEVWGVDVNGLSSQEKPKKKAFATWHLDRRQPVIAVTNHELGELVSGKISIKGTISDGNGIKALSYSLDNGENYLSTKISEDKKNGVWTFDLPIDTRLDKDGPAILWFKATDKMGSVGTYSYLYFIDNTKPDVKVVSPKEDEVCNGRFTVAGFAKDKVGLQKLSWSFNGQNGEFDLIPGNPYWSKEVDTRGINSKSIDFTVTALDTAGNLVVLKRNILLNQEADKPVVQIQFPENSAVVSGEAGSVFVRGIVTDDDGVASIEYSLDGGEAKTLESQGVFAAPLSEDADLSIGTHKITVTATDIHGVKGNPVTAVFTAMGPAPSFGTAKIGSADLVNGMLVHPESNPAYDVTVTSPSGITSVTYKVEYGDDAVFKEDTLTPKSPEKSSSVHIPLSDAPWGLLRITVTATDIYERVTEFKSLVNIKDLTYIHEDLLNAPLSEKIIEGNDNNGIEMSLISIGGAEYKGGMNVIIPHGGKESVPVVLKVETAEKSVSVTYTIEGEAETGGDVKQTGKAEFTGDHYEIKLANLPSRVTNLTVKAEAGKTSSATVRATFCVVRPVPEKRSLWTTGSIYWLPDANAVYNKSLNAYVIASEKDFIGYANVNGPVSPSVMTSGLSVSNEESTLGKTIKLTGLKDGAYRGVSVNVKDISGKSYSAPSVNIVVDSAAPELEIAAPANHQWVQTRTQITANATDANGIEKVEYSLDGGESWKEMSANVNQYSANINVSSFDDGLVGIDVRA
uniref:Ig-like domain-containing protein n=1 Tax=Treponema sp. TaxID=166 RepID=UPI00388F667D